MSKVANKTAVCPNCQETVYQYRSVFVNGTSEYYFSCICKFDFSVYHFDAKDTSNKICQTQSKCYFCKVNHKVPIIGKLTSADVVNFKDSVEARIPCYFCWTDDSYEKYKSECMDNPYAFFDF